MVEIMDVIALAVGPLPTNCYLLCDKEAKQAAVIDPGFEEELIYAELRKSGCRCRYVVLTHGHFDHRTAAGPLLVATGAKLAAHREEEPLLLDPEKSLYNLFRSYAGRPFEPLHADFLAEDGSSLKLGGLSITFLHTPGHTPGGCCLRCGGALFTGDTLFRDGMGRTDFPGGSLREILASVKRLGALPGDCTVYPGHGPQTTLARERAHNPYLQGLEF